MIATRKPRACLCSASEAGSIEAAFQSAGKIGSVEEKGLSTARWVVAVGY